MLEDEKAEAAEAAEDAEAARGLEGSEGWSRRVFVGGIVITSIKSELLQYSGRYRGRCSALPSGVRQGDEVVGLAKPVVQTANNTRRGLP